MTTPQPLSALSDPGSLAKLQILLVPVHSASSSLSEHTYVYWSSLIKRHTVLRGDELAQPAPSSSHTRGGGTQPRARFLPASSSTSISKGGAPNHIHITYPANPPARHLSNLSLLRIAAFPLVVLGIATEEESVNGYTIDEEDGDGDIGSSSSSNPTRTGSGLNESFQEQLAGLFPPTSPFPLVKRLLVVPKDAPLSYTPGETPRKGRRAPSRSGRGKNKASEDIIYAPTEGIESWMGRLLGEVVGDVLGELGELVCDTICLPLKPDRTGHSARNASRIENALVHASPLTHLHYASLTFGPCRISSFKLRYPYARHLSIKQCYARIHTELPLR